MEIKYFLFSFKGRIGRMHYWLFMVPIMLLLALLEKVVFDEDSEAFIDYELFITLLLIWPSLAVQAKRWHDRNKSAWWILINFIPIIGPLWALIENGIMPGDLGSNKYGEDPYAYLDEEDIPNKSLNQTGADNAPPG